MAVDFMKLFSNKMLEKQAAEAVGSANSKTLGQFPGEYILELKEVRPFMNKDANVIIPITFTVIESKATERDPTPANKGILEPIRPGLIACNLLKYPVAPKTPILGNFLDSLEVIYQCDHDGALTIHNICMSVASCLASESSTDPETKEAVGQAKDWLDKFNKQHAGRRLHVSVFFKGFQKSKPGVPVWAASWQLAKEGFTLGTSAPAPVAVPTPIVPATIPAVVPAVVAATSTIVPSAKQGVEL